VYDVRRDALTKKMDPGRASRRARATRKGRDDPDQVFTSKSASTGSSAVAPGRPPLCDCDGPEGPPGAPGPAPLGCDCLYTASPSFWTFCWKLSSARCSAALSDPCAAALSSAFAASIADTSA